MIKNFHKSGGKYDEYYTTYEEVEFIFDNLNIPVKDKIIYCFCDSEESNFVIYLKAHKEELGYKELIYTWDDYNNHLDLFDKADIYITNPPFSKIIKEIIPILNNHQEKDFFLFGSIAMVSRYRQQLNDLYIYRRPNFYFITPHINDVTGTNKTFVTLSCYFTNIKQSYFDKEIKYKELDKYVKFKSDNIEGIVVDKIKHIPQNYEGYILAPITVLLNPVFDNYQLCNNKLKGLTYSDNKSRYVRLLIKNIR